MKNIFLLAITCVLSSCASLEEYDRAAAAIFLNQPAPQQTSFGEEYLKRSQPSPQYPAPASAPECSAYSPRKHHWNNRCSYSCINGSWAEVCR